MDAAQANEPEETNEAATKAAVFCAAERLFALAVERWSPPVT